MAHNKEKSLKLNMILNGIKGLMGIVFPLISFPYVSKILGVENLGKYNFASSIVSYVALVAALGFATYAIREGARIRDNREQFSEFASQIYTMNLCATVIAYLGLAIVVLLIPKFNDYRALITILAISVVFQTYGCEWIYSVYEEYIYITVRSILLQLLSLIMLFVLVKTPQDLNVYAALSVGAGVISNLLNRIVARKYAQIRIKGRVDWKLHLKPIIVLFAMNAAVTLYVSSDITILGILCGNYTVGIYSVSVKVYNIVKTMLSAVVVVAIPRLASLLGKEQKDAFDETASDIYATLITVVLPAVTGIILLSREIVLIISDEIYLDAVPSLIILSATLLMCLCAGFWGHGILIPVKKEGVVLKATIASAVVNVVLNLILIPFWGEVAAAITTFISELLAFIMCAWAARNDVELHGIGPTVIKSIIGCMAIVVFVLLLGMLQLNMVVHVLVSVVGSVIIYMIAELLMKNSALQSLRSLIRK